MPKLKPLSPRNPEAELSPEWYQWNQSHPREVPRSLDRQFQADLKSMIGNDIKNARANAKMGRERFAKIIGTTEYRLKQLEQGEVFPTVYELIIVALGADVPLRHVMPEEAVIDLYIRECEKRRASAPKWRGAK